MWSRPVNIIVTGEHNHIQPGYDYELTRRPILNMFKVTISRESVFFVDRFSPLSPSRLLCLYSSWDGDKSINLSLCLNPLHLFITKIKLKGDKLKFNRLSAPDCVYKCCQWLSISLSALWRTLLYINLLSVWYSVTKIRHKHKKKTYCIRLFMIRS